MNISSADIISREELYELIWKEPIAVFTRKNEISEYALRKACKVMKIPTPKAGYWENIRLGKKISRLSLSQDPAVISYITLSSIKKAGTNTPRQKNQQTTTNHAFDIRVSEPLLERAVRWLNYFIETVKARNHTITQNNGSTYIVIYGQTIKFYLRELTKTSGPKSKWLNAPLVPTGLLAFKVDGYWGKEWRDGKASLEEQFISIIEELELKARSFQEESADLETGKIAAKEIAKNARLKKMLVEKELEAFKQLLQRAERWQKAQSLRDYIAQLKTNAIAANEMTPELSEKIQWAEEKADWYDPRTNIADELFAAIDKDSL